MWSDGGASIGAMVLARDDNPSKLESDILPVLLMPRRSTRRTLSLPAPAHDLGCCCVSSCLAALSWYAHPLLSRNQATQIPRSRCCCCGLLFSLARFYKGKQKNDCPPSPAPLLCLSHCEPPLHPHQFRALARCVGFFVLPAPSTPTHSFYHRI